MKYTGWTLKNLKTGELFLGFFHVVKEELEKELYAIYNKEEWEKLEEERCFGIVPAELKEIAKEDAKDETFAKTSLSITWIQDETFLLADGDGNQRIVEDLEEMVNVIGSTFDELISKESE